MVMFNNLMGLGKAPQQESMKFQRPKRNEIVMYDSAKAKRTIIGKWHYCMSCPGWNKLTDKRVVYSTWVKKDCCGGSLPWGRNLDTYDADIIIDASARQTLCQVCRGEGDIILYRLAGGDPSNPDTTHLLSDVPRMFDVFNEVTFELSKINLKGHAGKCLGRRMGAMVMNMPAGYEGEPQATKDIDTEVVFYDSRTAKRTLLGKCCNMDCCYPTVAKITSERVMYSEWDIWYLCDEPLKALCLPYYCCRGICQDVFPCCTFLRPQLGVDAEGNEAEFAMRAQRKVDSGIADCCCICPTGRNAMFWDLDIMVDIGARQKCKQLFINEGDLLMHRLPGGDADSTETIFKVRNVPEVFGLFDDLSYELSQMDLSHFRQNVIGQKMMDE